MNSRRIALLLLAVVATLLTVWALRSGEVSPVVVATPSQQREDELPGGMASTAATESRTAVQVSPGTNAGAAPGKGRVSLRAIDHDTEQPIADFSWRATTAWAGLPTDGAAQGTIAQFDVPIGVSAVRVSAPGYATSLAVNVSVEAAGGFRDAIARLVSADLTLSLAVTADNGQPVPRIQIDGVRRPTDRGPRDQTAITSRSSHAPNGVHALMNWAPGDYQLTIAATAADGRPALLQPHSLEVRLVDREVARDVRLLPGGSIVLELSAPAGRQLGRIETRLLDANGASKAVRWRPLAAGQEREGTPWVLANEPCELAWPLAPGSYSLELTGTGFDDRRSVQVWAGQRTPVRVALP